MVLKHEDGTLSELAGLCFPQVGDLDDASSVGNSCSTDSIFSEDLPPNQLKDFEDQHLNVTPTTEGLAALVPRAVARDKSRCTVDLKIQILDGSLDRLSSLHRLRR